MNALLSLSLRPYRRFTTYGGLVYLTSATVKDWSTFRRCSR